MRWKRQIPALLIVIAALAGLAVLWVQRLRGPDPLSGWLIAATVIVASWVGLRTAVWLSSARAPRAALSATPQQPKRQWPARMIEAGVLWGIVLGSFGAMRACGASENWTIQSLVLIPRI